MKIKIKRRRLRDVPIKRNIPNFITSGNFICGMLSIILAIHGHYLYAAWAIPAGVFFDLMDGGVARKLKVTSDFGVEFDSLCDLVSFGVAPAILVYLVSLKEFPTDIGILYGATAAILFALCGALRLARFNIAHKPGPFQGLPIPAGGLFLVSWVIADIIFSPTTMSLIVIFTGFLMISSVPYGNLKALKKGFINKKKQYFLVGLILAIAVFCQNRAPLVLIFIYIASGLLRFDWGKWLALPPYGDGDEFHDVKP